MADPVTIGIEVAIMAASMAYTASQKIEGPRLDTLDVTLAEYGTPLPRFWGIRRFDVPIVWAEKLREKKVTTKTKGGKYANYKYYGTWAVVVADQHIDSVSRVWLDKHLAYDVTGTGPVSIGALLGDKDAVKLVEGTNFRVYLGDQTTPDPRIESWCEDRYGADTCPAYKDVAYIVFQDIPLEKFGNRIPQISVEAISAKSSLFPYETVTSRLEDDNLSFSPDFARMLTTDSSGDALDIWDTATRKIIVSRTAGADSASNLVFGDDGNIYGITGFAQTFAMTLSSDGGSLLASSSFGHSVGGVIWAGGTACYTPLGAQNRIFWYGDGVAVALDTSFVPNFYFTGPNGNPWAVGVSGTNVVFCDFLLSTSITATIGSSNTDVYALTNTDGKIFCRQGNSLFILDPVTVVVGATGTATESDPSDAFANHPAGNSIWFRNSEYSTLDCTLIRTVAYSSWYTGALSKCFDPVNNALVGSHSGLIQTIDWLYLDRVGSNGVTLQTVVDDVSTWCGLSGQDTSTLTQTVQGYSVTQGSGKDMLSPLLDIHDVDPRPHDWNVQFVVRGGAPVGTITTSELVREGEDSRYIASITQDTDLPRKITFSFADKDHDQQANNAIAQRPLDSVDTTREQSIDLGTYVETPSGAQQFADRYLRRQWIGRQKFSLGLTAQRLALEPADLYSLQLDDITVKARLTKVTLTNGKLQTEWDRDGASVHTVGTGAGAAMDGRDPEMIYIPGPTKGLVKDVPLLSDAESNLSPLLHYAAGPYNSTQNWPGAYIMQADATGANYDTEWGSVDSAHGAYWGYATDVLADAKSTLWDRGNTVNVSGYLTLTSCTEADINADPTLNLALLGDELLNFTTATLESDGSYTLSGFKRGRRGTEWATSTHTSGDEFVLATSLLNDGVGLSDVGTALHFKVQTLGRPIDSSPAIDITFAGRTLKPYAPASIAWTWDGTNLTGTITRRTRLGGAWVGGSTIPLSENSEAYEIDVYNGVTFKRTISVTATNVFTYTAAMAAADGITLPTPPSVKVYQMSDAVGRGFALAA